MEMKFLLDSNVVIDFLGAKLPNEAADFVNLLVDEIPMISVITRIEVLSFNTEESEYSVLKSFCDDSKVLSITDEIVNTTIQVRLRHKIKTPDAIIAATAMVNELVLVTRNTDDFKSINGLVIINPLQL